MKNILKLIITIVIFYFLFQYIDFEHVIKVLEKSHGGFILLALIAQLASTLVAAYRWRLIMKLLGFHEKVSFYVQSYFRGSFFNQVLPGSIGGDAVRAIELVQKGYDKKDSIYGIFVDRIIGLVGLLVLNLIANNLFYGSFPSWLHQLLNLITIGGIAGFSMLFIFERFSFLSKFSFSNLFVRLSKRLNRLYETKMLLMQHIAITIIVHIFSILAIYGLALSVEVDLNMQTLLIAIPPVFLLTIVPISLAGWGVRESGMVGILMLVGAQKEEILVISVLYGLLLILAALPGAWFWNKNKQLLQEKE
ncbi:MAG: lysylphosphatidylglycerol synthase transmembrane domain-containing protein [Campylobacterota bacterium]|nr:lysylphosphatidylglycerol synthase transmembrane domain-containing protein [Campylobacterota bacterium]